MNDEKEPLEMQKAKIRVRVPRTDEEEEEFRQALKNINLWYANSETMVWRLTKLPPAGRPGHDVRPYLRRGWCLFELAISEILTPSDKCLDLGLAREDNGNFLPLPTWSVPPSTRGHVNHKLDSKTVVGHCRS